VTDVHGRASRKAATVALKAHLKVLKKEPLRLSLSEALREASSLGGQERRFAALATRELSRHQRYLDLAAKHLGFPPSRWGLKEDETLARYSLWRRLFTKLGWERIRNEVALPGPIRPRSVKDDVLKILVEAPLETLSLGEGVDRLANVHSFPTWLVKSLESAYPDQLEALLPALNREQAVQLRVRPGMTAEEAAKHLAEEQVATRILSEHPAMLVVEDVGHRVFESALYKRHALQQQDFGSVLISELCRPSRGESAKTVVDFCAGAGGKTLALADQVGSEGKVFASDLSRRRLEDARSRVRVAGLKNVAFPHPVDVTKADVVLVDAPCSGTGSLARDPDQKWKLKAQDIPDFAKKQRDILQDLARKVRPGALLVYATCSLLPEENEQNVHAFLAEHPAFERLPAEEVLSKDLAERFCRDGDLHVLPQNSPGGGFYAARLRRTR
jgi:16S rRNA (cytosine967-C5)-methyltransferase